jgi:hypothetical protein
MMKHDMTLVDGLLVNSHSHLTSGKYQRPAAVPFALPVMKVRKRCLTFLPTGNILLSPENTMEIPTYTSFRLLGANHNGLLGIRELT